MNITPRHSYSAEFLLHPFLPTARVVPRRIPLSPRKHMCACQMRSVITRASKSKTVAARHGQRHGGRLFHVASTSPGIHDHANAREDLNEHCARRKLSSITPASPPRDPKSSLQPSKTSPRTGSSGSNSIRNVNNPAGTSTRTNTVKRGGSKYINHVYDIHTRGNDASVLLRLGAARAKSTAAAPASTQMDEADSAVNDRYDDLAASPSPGVSGSVSMRNDKNNTTSNSLPGRGLVKSFRLTGVVRSFRGAPSA